MWRRPRPPKPCAAQRGQAWNSAQPRCSIGRANFRLYCQLLPAGLRPRPQRVRQGARWPLDAILRRHPSRCARRVYVRDSTISRLCRKVALSAKGVARGFATAHPKLNASEILVTFNYADFSQRISRVHPDELSPDDYGAWTFSSHLKRASETFVERGAPIVPQARSFKATMKDHRASDGS